MMLPISTYDLENPASTERLINCYAEPITNGRSPVIVKRCPGLINYSSNANGKWRGPGRLLWRHPAGGHLLFYADGTTGANMWVLENREAGSVLEFTGNAVSGEYWDVASNADTSVITYDKTDNGGTDYTASYITWNDTTDYSILPITDADFLSRQAAEVEFLDNYFLFREPGSARFFGSDVGSATAYTSTSFATAEASGDKLVGMKATNANLLLFGEETIEIWDAVGGSGFPFRRIINGAIDKGCFTGRSVAEIDDTIFWVADDKTVRMLQGMEPVKISNFAVDGILERATALSNARGFTYTFAGHNYYVLRMHDRCLVYDITTGQWHERKSPGSESWAWGLSAGCYGKTWFGRVENPISYQDHDLVAVAEMSEDSYYDDQLTAYSKANTSTGATDVPMVMEWTYQPVWGSGARVFHDRLEIVVQTGVGNSDSTDPVVQLDISDDGGQTWFQAEDRAMGAQGETFQRVVWQNLGSSYQRVYRARVSDPVPVTVMSTELQAMGGSV